MNGPAYSSAAAELIFTPWGKSSKQESQNAPLNASLLKNPGFVRKFNILHSATVARVLNRLYLWQDRAEQRARLSEMDSRLLKDIGVTRPEAAAEARKPFWMA